MGKVINIQLPTSWAELSQEQLRFLYKTMSICQQEFSQEKFRGPVDYSAQLRAAIATKCLIRWGGLKIVTPYADGWLLERDGVQFEVNAEKIASLIQCFDWIASLPDSPVRLDSIGGHAAIAADLSEDFPFSEWLTCENLWQGYQQNKDESLLKQMAGHLYKTESLEMGDAETLSIFYWWASVKIYIAARFPHFFKESSGEATSTPGFDDLRRNMDNQIRALTKGDITKEEEILSMETWRALTELDAQAYEYEELNKKYGNH
jgi:hypothetical protein